MTGPKIERTFNLAALSVTDAACPARFMEVWCSQSCCLALASDRDKVDVISSMAGAYALSESLQLGLEAVGEDLEGFWESDEAEGGAKILAGPTLWYRPYTPLVVKLNIGAIATMSTRSSSSSNRLNTYGIQSRLVLGYRF